MPYGETKVYCDGSHYIAIPHTTKPVRKRPKPMEELITVMEEIKDNQETENTLSSSDDVSFPLTTNGNVDDEQEPETPSPEPPTVEEKPKT